MRYFVLIFALVAATLHLKSVKAHHDGAHKPSHPVKKTRRVRPRLAHEEKIKKGVDRTATPVIMHLTASHLARLQKEQRT